MRSIATNVRFRGHVWHSVVALAVVLLMASAAEVLAQPNLNFKRVTVNWPTIELYFNVGCNGGPAYNMSAQDFHITENGIPVTNFSLLCPDPTTRCSISTALVFDASGSMSGTGNAGAKAGGRAFIDLMDGQIDEASIIWFNTMVNISQQMTTLKPLLYSAVDALPASGGTAVWDGTYAGIISLINDGVNLCRSVIVVTDGGDNASTRTPAEIISLANRNKIRVFTVGLGTSINATELEMIALLTGGRYYQTPNAGQLAAIFADIFTIVSQSFQECVLTYDRDCADGSMRTVQLTLQNFCGGTDAKTKSYRAPLDSTTYTTLRMRLDKTVSLPGQDVTLALNLKSQLTNTMLPPFSFLIPSDTSCAILKSISIPAGAILDGIPVTMTPEAGGVRVQTGGGKLVTGSGRMMNLILHTAPVIDTTCCDVTLTDFQFESGCFVPDVEPGEVCIIPGASIPLVSCRMDAPAEILWDEPSQSFSPDPFDVTMHIKNNGTVDARNTRFRVFYDTDMVSRVSPSSDTQNGNPTDLAPGMESSVTWTFHPKKATANIAADIAIEAYFDNHDTVHCEEFIPFGPILECNLTVPTITYDVGTAQYTPMPFPVMVAVKNTGGMPAELPIATISFIPDLQLAPGYPLSIVLRPDQLDPQETATATWSMQHVKIQSERTYTITARVTSTTADSIHCESELRIPAAKEGFRFPITASGSLTLCAGADVTLDAGPGYLDYWWNTGDRTQQITVSKSGAYFCIVRDSTGAQGVSDTLRVTVAPVPHPLINPVGSIPMCEGDTLILEAPTGYVSYAWNSGSKSRIELAMQAGDYWCSPQ